MQWPIFRNTYTGKAEKSNFQFWHSNPNFKNLTNLYKFFHEFWQACSLKLKECTGKVSEKSILEKRRNPIFNFDIPNPSLKISQTCTKFFMFFGRHVFWSIKNVIANFQKLVYWKNKHLFLHSTPYLKF